MLVKGEKFKMFYNLDDLEIVGYSDCLNWKLVPHIVPPILKLKNSTTLIIAPFVFKDNTVEGLIEDYKSFKNKYQYTSEATFFDEKCFRFQAKKDYELWVDSDGLEYYEPREIVSLKLKEISNNFKNEAKERFNNILDYLGDDYFRLNDDLEEILLKTQKAFNADNKNLEAILLKALVWKKQKEMCKLQIEGLKRISKVIDPKFDFDSELSKLNIKEFLNETSLDNSKSQRR